VSNLKFIVSILNWSPEVEAEFCSWTLQVMNEMAANATGMQKMVFIKYNLEIL